MSCLQQASEQAGDQAAAAKSAGCGRSVIVTGAGKGLGAAFASAWASRGARVLVNNRHLGTGRASAEVLAQRLRAEGCEAVADLHAVDAPGAAAAIIEAALEAFGRLDVLILNAGISGAAAKVINLDDAIIRSVMEINFHANTALVRAALPHLLDAPHARILFVSSTAGLHGVRGRAAYAASKGALNAYALSLAAELRSARVGVNVLMPYAATAMTAAEAAVSDPRLATDQASPAALWLTSAACAETGGIWIAGAGWFRRAQALESIGLGNPAASPEWCAENAAAISDMAGARSYPDAEAAFADLYRSAAMGDKSRGAES